MLYDAVVILLCLCVGVICFQMCVFVRKLLFDVVWFGLCVSMLVDVCVCAFG